MHEKGGVGREGERGRGKEGSERGEEGRGREEGGGGEGGREELREREGGEKEG